VLVAVVAAVIAAGAFYVAMTYKSSPAATTPNQTAPTATPVPMVSVVEVSTAVTAGEKVSASNLALVPVPRSSLPAAGASGTTTYYTGSTAVATLASADEFYSVALSAGTVVQSTMLTATTGPSAQPNAVPVTLLSGDVALSIPDTALEGAGGYPEPGEQIDIMVDIWAATGTPSLVAYGTFTGVRVIEVGAAGSAGGASAALILVELPLAQARDLGILDNSTNVSFHYVLVAKTDYDAVASDATESISVVGGGTNWQSLMGGV
jgi:Flp pilus assembly protein CpaB